MKDNKSTGGSANAKQDAVTDADLNKPWEREDKYQSLQKSKDQRFGDIEVFKEMWTNEVVFTKEKIINGKNEASAEIIELRKKIALGHPHLQRLFNYSSTVKKDLCATHYIIKGIYEFPQTDLSKEAADRKKSGHGFSHSDLCHLAYQILHGLLFLHSHNLVHADIRPLLIGFDKPTNHFYLLERLTDPSPLEKVQANNIINKKELFLSPQLYQKLQGKDKAVKYSPTKNDLFALGLVVLALGNNQSFQDIYKPHGEFNQEKLLQHIANFEAKYAANNQHLVIITKALLQPNEDQRPEARDLLSSILPYEDYKRQDMVNFQGTLNYVVQGAPQEIIKVSPNETHYLQSIETKISYGQPMIRNKVYHQGQSEFDQAPIPNPADSKEAEAKNEKAEPPKKDSVTVKSKPSDPVNRKSVDRNSRNDSSPGVRRESKSPNK